MKLHVEIMQPDKFTERECEVLQLVCEGQADKAIARQLAISARTVATHLDHIYEKLDLKQQSINTRCAAIATCVASGMIKIGRATVCLLLIFGALHLDEQTVRVGRLQLRTPSARVRRYEA